MSLLIQHTVFRKLSSNWGTECLCIRFILSTLPHVEYIAKLFINKTFRKQQSLYFSNINQNYHKFRALYNMQSITSFKMKTFYTIFITHKLDFCFFHTRSCHLSYRQDKVQGLMPHGDLLKISIYLSRGKEIVYIHVKLEGWLYFRYKKFLQ